jgi:hypothetical protein
MRGHFLRASLAGAVGGGGGYTPTDSDAAAYITAVENEDGQALEDGVREAIDDFVIGCKADGIWSAIKACCILAGARTLDGALVPLVGAAPTRFNFVAGDYNRETGLAGNASDKYLDSNRAGNADPQNSRHVSLWVTSWTLDRGSAPLFNNGGSGSGRIYMQRDGVTNNLNVSIANSLNVGVTDGAIQSGFFGINRSASSTINYAIGSLSASVSSTSATPNSGNFRPYITTAGPLYSTARLSFYSIGESLNLALLDARVSTLMTDIATAIP